MFKNSYTPGFVIPGVLTFMGRHQGVLHPGVLQPGNYIQGAYDQGSYNQGS